MINKITLTISEKDARAAHPLFRKKFLSMGILFSLMLLFNSHIYSQTTQILTIPSGLLKVNTGLSQLAYIYSEAYLNTKAAIKTEQLGGLTLAQYNLVSNYI